MKTYQVTIKGKTLYFEASSIAEALEVCEAIKKIMLGDFNGPIVLVQVTPILGAA